MRESAKGFGTILFTCYSHCLRKRAGAKASEPNIVIHPSGIFRGSGAGDPVTGTVSRKATERKIRLAGRVSSQGDDPPEALSASHPPADRGGFGLPNNKVILAGAFHLRPCAFSGRRNREWPRHDAFAANLRAVNSQCITPNHQPAPSVAANVCRSRGGIARRHDPDATGVQGEPF